LLGQDRVERDVGRFARRRVDFLHRPADSDPQRIGVRGEIAVIVAAALADPAAVTVETDERAEISGRGFACGANHRPGCWVPQGPFTRDSPGRQRRKSIVSIARRVMGQGERTRHRRGPQPSAGCRVRRPTRHRRRRRRDRREGSESGAGRARKAAKLRHAVEVGGEMLAAKAQLFAQSLLLLDQIGGQVGHRLL
jgi:hypothetical protein